MVFDFRNEYKYLFDFMSRDFCKNVANAAIRTIYLAE